MGYESEADEDVFESTVSLFPPLARMEYESDADEDEFESTETPFPPLARMEYESEAASNRLFGDWLGSFPSEIVFTFPASSFGLERASATTLLFP